MRSQSPRKRSQFPGPKWKAFEGRRFLEIFGPEEKSHPVKNARSSPLYFSGRIPSHFSRAIVIACMPYQVTAFSLFSSTLLNLGRSFLDCSENSVSRYSKRVPSKIPLIIFRFDLKISVFINVISPISHFDPFPYVELIWQLTIWKYDKAFPLWLKNWIFFWLTFRVVILWIINDL